MSSSRSATAKILSSNRDDKTSHHTGCLVGLSRKSAIGDKAVFNGVTINAAPTRHKYVASREGGDDNDLILTVQ